MSHFATLVITSAEPSADVLKATLQPFHEYECTGIEDQYVIDVDVTDEVLETFAKYTYTRWVDGDGVRHDPHDDRFYRDPIPEDELGRGPHGHGGNGKISWSSQDWGDGRGYRTKVHLKAADVGMTEIEVPASEINGIAEWADDYGGWKQRDDGRFIKHTNPNAQWDWWQIGGRYSGRLRSLSGEAIKGRPGLCGSQTDENGADVVRRGDLDFETMRLARIGQRAETIAELLSKSGMTAGELDRALLLKPQVDEAWQALAHPKPRGEEYTDWVRSTFGDDGELLSRAMKVEWSLPELGRHSGADAWVKAAPALTSWAVLKDGIWTEKGSMGWWGVSTGDMDDEEWQTKVSDLVQSLPADHWLTVVDCHI